MKLVIKLWNECESIGSSQVIIRIKSNRFLMRQVSLECVINIAVNGLFLARSLHQERPLMAMLIPRSRAICLIGQQSIYASNQSKIAFSSRTLHYLMLHLHRVASHAPKTGMTAKNLAIVWAPNLIRSDRILPKPTMP